MIDISNLRQNYSKDHITEEELSDSPFKQFEMWLSDALRKNVIEPNAMVLSTVNEHLQPSSRIVLLKQFDENGFVFYTNYNSRKGIDIKNNNKACILFFWPLLERQVRIEGTVEKISSELSNEYYNSRPLESRIGAWVSMQSQEITNREELEKREKYFINKFGQNPKRPDYWGGYNLKPKSFEFWQGRPSRLHDRILYVSEEKDIWKKSRLYP